MSNDLDFEAWEAPPPPDGLADAVIARMGGTAVGLAIPDVPRRRRWVIAASAAAVLVLAGGAWAIVHGRERAPAQNGAVIAERAQHVELPGASAELDRGADIHWHRTSDGLDIEQRAGTAVWRVGKDERIVIGVAGASIEAAGASLRVEVPMNLPVSKTDARVIGASAVTAAVVAMATVVVYEGHVKVASSGQTVVVQPGTTYTVHGPTPVPEPPVVGVAPVTVAGGHRKLAVLGLERGSGDGVAHDLVEGLRARAKTGSGPFQLAAASDKELADEVLLHDCENQAPACMAMIGQELGADDLMYGSMESERAGYRVTLKLFDVSRKLILRTTTQLIPATQSQGAALAGWSKQIYDILAGADVFDSAPTQEEIDNILAPHDDELAACLGNVEDTTLKFTLGPDGVVTDEQVDDDVKAEVGVCMANVLDAMSFPASQHGGTFSRFVKRASCDLDALMAQGNEAMGKGDSVAALVKYEAAIACKPQPRLYQLAFMASCNARNATKASQYFGKLSKDSQERMLQICVRNGITRDELDPSSCDAEALKQKGMTVFGAGQHAAALALFEQAIKCQPDEKLYQLAFMAACSAKSVSKSQYYWSRLPDGTREQLKQMCVRNGISAEMLAGQASAAPDAASGLGQVRVDSVPQAKVLFDGIDSGATPVLVKAMPGKHKVTLVVGQDRFTYPVVVKAGETETLSKDLQ